MPDCPQCATRMTHNDETTKLTEYVCPNCHFTTLDRKEGYRVTA